MRNNKYSRLKLYIITTFFAFVVSSAIISFFIVNYSDDYLQSTINYINGISPVNISIKNVSIDYPLRVVLNDFKVYSKTNSHGINNFVVTNKEFLSIPSSSIFFNPFKILVGRGIFYCISDIYVNDAYLYPGLIDEKLFASGNTNDKSNIKTKIENTLYTFEGKNIRIDNFNVDIADNNNEHTRMSLQYIRADLRGNNYSLDTALFLQGNTDIRLSLNSKKDISYLESKLLINNNKHTILDFYVNYEVDTNDIFTIDLKNGEQSYLGYVHYDYKNKNADFSITNLVIRKENIVSFYDAISSIPILQKLPIDNSFSNVIEEFSNIVLFANGSIEKNKISNFDMSVSSKAENFALDFDMKITNNIAYSTNFYMRFDNGILNADFSFPINNPVLMRANVKMSDFNIETNTLALDLSVTPSLSNNKRTLSRLSLNNLSYKETITEPLFFDIEYLKNENTFNISVVTNDFIRPHITTIYLSKESKEKVISYGRINKEILVPFLGRGTIDNLSSLFDIDYKLYKDNNNNFINDLDLNVKKMYSEEEMADINISVYSNKVVLKKLDYVLGSNIVHLSFDAVYNKKGEIELEGDLKSPMGVQKIMASLKNSNSIKYLNAYTDDGLFKASGYIASNGNLDFNLGTTKTIDINGVSVDAKVSIDNIVKTNKEYNIWGYVRAEQQKYAVFNLGVDFEVSNTSILFTNIDYAYRDIVINGNAVLSRENNIISLASSLKDIHSGGYFNTTFTVNKDNVFGSIDMTDMQLAMTAGQSDIYGVVNTKITVMGLLTEPIVQINNFSIKDLEVPGYKFDVALSGSYKKEELELTNISIIKTGQGGFVVSQSANKIEHITIPRAYFSKDVHSLSMDIQNMKFVSTITAKINYSMKKLLNGDNEYTLTTSPIKINNRKLPPFSTAALYNGNNLTLKSLSSHGIDGSIRNGSSNMLVDLLYLFENKAYLNVEGGIKKEGTNQVDLMLTSNNLGLEIFEVFNNLFVSIDSGKTNFVVDNKEYTLNARLHGNMDNLQIHGRFLGHGNKIKISYFSDTFVNTDLDVIFDGHSIRVNTLEFYTKNKKWLKVTGEGEFTENTISFMDFDILSSDEQIGLLYANTDIDILKSKGPSHVDLSFTGSLQNPRLNGTITLIKNDVELTMGPENVYTERVFGILSRQYFDLTIQALRSIRVVHNLVGDVSIENGSTMKVIGSKEQGINLQGTINFERGNIYYLQNVYTVERGFVTFPEVNSLDPIINTTAYTYTKYIPPTITVSANPNADSYSVTLYMEMNSRVSQILFSTSTDNMPVRFYTIPTLGQSQVNQLAGVSTLDRGEGSRIYNNENNLQAGNSAVTISEQLQQQEQTVQAYGDLFLRNIALRPIERWARQFIGIDYISFSPTAARNILFRDDGTRLTALSILDETSVSIGKYSSKDLYFKYDVTYRFNDPERPLLFNKSENSYYFEHQFGFEVSLLRDFNLANFLFEYKINPFDMNIVKQEFNVLARWRL